MDRAAPPRVGMDQIPGFPKVRPKIEFIAVRRKIEDVFVTFVLCKLKRFAPGSEHDEDLVVAVCGRGENDGAAIRGEDSVIHGLVPVADFGDF